MVILGIETSCDETAVSVVKAEGGSEDLSFKVLGSAINSQIEMHSEFGGVVPNLAKREHQKNLLPVLIEALRKTDLIWNHKSPISNEFSNLEEFLNKTEKPKIDLIVVTVGPGLEPALWVGIEFAKKLSKKWDIPIIGANHMEGHIASVLINKSNKNSESESKFSTQDGPIFGWPVIALLISGGHTELIYLKNWAEKEKIGQTLDDAVGEAFDKVARMMNLPYPGGPEISKLAERARKEGLYLDKKLPRPMIHSGDFNFSFSGLKTAVLYYLNGLRNSSEYSETYSSKKSFFLKSPRFSPLRGARLFFKNFSYKNNPEIKNDGEISEISKIKVAREFEDAVIETLITKTKMAIEKYNPKTLIIGGGVIANKALRENFLDLKKKYKDLEILIPEKSLTTDNASMIAVAGYIEYLIGERNELKANGNLSI